MRQLNTKPCRGDSSLIPRAIVLWLAGHVHTPAEFPASWSTHRPASSARVPASRTAACSDETDDSGLGKKRALAREGQRLHFRGVRVALGTGYTRAQGIGRRELISPTGIIPTHQCPARACSLWEVQVQAEDMMKEATATADLPLLVRSNPLYSRRCNVPRWSGSFSNGLSRSRDAGA